MKRNLFIILSALIAVLAVAFGLAACDSGNSDADSDFKFTPLGKDGYEVKLYSGDAAEITIPSTYMEKPVISIGERAFFECRVLTDVNIPEGVLRIGFNAFYNCSGLAHVSLPDGLTLIDAYAFGNCDALANIQIPDTVNTIGSGAFMNCKELSGITIPDGVTSIESSTFQNCSSLTSLTIPEGVTFIGRSAFEGCGGLTSLIIPDGVTYMGESAVKGCSGLTSLTIPFVGAVADITQGTDSEQEMWKRSTHFGYIFGAPNSGYHMDKYYGVPASLKTVIITGGRIVYEAAFSDCESIESVTFSDSLTYIAPWAFSGCSGLKSVALGGSLNTIGTEAFSGCSELKSIVIPDKVKSIKEKTFYNCSELLSVTIGKSVSQIYDRAFGNCNLLYEVYNLSELDIVAGSGDYGEVAKNALDVYTSLDEKSKLTQTEEGYLIYTGYYWFVGDGVNIIRYTGNSEELVIPDGVTAIVYNVFNGCDEIKSVTIPDSITYIGSSAFSECGGLTDITFDGTIEQWKQIISVAVGWDSRTGNYIIHCNDGDYTKELIKI